MIDVIVFSKNRPLQLYALLESMLSFTDAGQVAQVSVIYSYDDEYSSALDEVKKKFEGITFIKQTNFKRDVATALFASTNDFCTFFIVPSAKATKLATVMGAFTYSKPTSMLPLEV